MIELEEMAEALYLAEAQIAIEDYLKSHDNHAPPETFYVGWIDAIISRRNERRRRAQWLLERFNIERRR